MRPLAHGPTASLFDEQPAGDGPVARFDQAFSSWLADQQGAGTVRQASVIEVYLAMWESFSAWCLGQSPSGDLASLTLEDLQAFQAARFGRKSTDRSLSPRYALRLLRLIDHVLRHHAAATDTPVNTAPSDWIAANPEVRYSEAETKDPLPEYLTAPDARQLITFLSSARPRPGRDRDALSAMSWQEVRNRASVALQLGAGLTPGDVRALMLGSPISQGGRTRGQIWKLSVPGNGTAGKPG